MSTKTRYDKEVMGVYHRGFYNRVAMSSSKRAQDNALLTEMIKNIFDANQQIYEALRIHRALIEHGHSCSLNQIA